MINMDMIGRLNDSTKALMIYGVGTAPDWVPIISSMRSVSESNKIVQVVGYQIKHLFISRIFLCYIFHWSAFQIIINQLMMQTK